MDTVRVDICYRPLRIAWAMDREDLIRLWRKLYGSEPPRRMSSSLMMCALAYKVQEQALGGLRPATRSLLAMVAKEEDNPNRIVSASVSPSTRLIREGYARGLERGS